MKLHLTQEEIEQVWSALVWHSRNLKARSIHDKDPNDKLSVEVDKLSGKFVKYLRTKDKLFIEMKEGNK